MTANKWPWPNDDPVTRARKVAHEYRQALERLDPYECHRLDLVVGNMGQDWIKDPCATVLTVNETADLLGITPHAVRKAVREGKLRSERLIAGEILIDRGDAQAYNNTRRRHPLA